MTKSVVLTFENPRFKAGTQPRIPSRPRAAQGDKGRRVEVKLAAAAARRNAHLLSVKARATRVVKRVSAAAANRRKSARNVLMGSMRREAEASIRRFSGIRSTVERLDRRHAKVAGTQLARARSEAAELAEAVQKLQLKLESSEARRKEQLQRRVEAAAAEAGKAARARERQLEEAQRAREERMASLSSRLESAALRRSARLAQAAASPRGSPRIVTASWSIDF